LVGGDVIYLTTSNYLASGLGTGGAPPNKVQVTFDVQITNLLSSTQLVKPTFPTPPSSADAVYLFPFSTNVTTTSGGATGSGNEIIVDLPNNGQVEPSTDFNGDGTPGLDGSPWNFFNDTGCGAGSNDCYRYEAFAAPIAPLATTTGQKIGFLIDPTVSNFRARIIVAADLQNSGAATTATVQGTVTSPQIGPISGATVTVSGAGTATTSGSGSYSVANVGPGPHTVSVSGLPSGCTTPSSQNISVSGTAPITADFTVTCNAPVGTVTGSIVFQSGSATPSLASATVTVTPSASGTTTATGSPNAAGAYSVSNVLVGIGTGAGEGAVSVSNLPSGCSVVGANSSSYTGLTAGGSVAATPSITINCVAPPAFYQYSTSWSAVSGGQVTLTLKIDMSTLNDPDNNGTGPDEIGAFQADVAYNATRLTVQSCSTPTLSGAVNTANPGSISFGLFTTNSVTGQVTLATCTFTVNGGTPPVTTATTNLLLGDRNGVDISAHVQVTESTLP
jgi:hypothetical protein